MGHAYSNLDTEKKTWTSHTLEFDEETRAANLKFLKLIKNGSKIYLACQTFHVGKIKLEHWFITDKVAFIEFGSPKSVMYDAKVTIKTKGRSNYTCSESKAKTMDGEMRERICDVLGMSNYSLCLRNSEHVANYIFSNRWVSVQMEENLLSVFKSDLIEENSLKLVNTFPYPLQLKADGTKNLYSFLEPHYSFSRTEYYLDYNEDDYNVLILGPSGAGKSNLVNVIFNKNICLSDSSLKSVTYETIFVRGKASIYDGASKTWTSKNVVVTDTVGLCDTEWDDEKIVKLIKTRISANIKYVHCVLIVYREGRLLKEMKKSIHDILKWLDYTKNFLRIQFVMTHTEFFADAKKQELKSEIIEMFNLGKIHMNSVICVGFPAEENITEPHKLKVGVSYESLRSVLTNTSMAGNPIAVPSVGNGLCTIL